MGNNKEKRIVSGLIPFYEDYTELLDKNLILLTNLEHATIRGELSEGMILCAESFDKKTVKVLESPTGTPGDSVYVSENIKPQRTITYKTFSKIKITIEEHEVKINDNNLRDKTGIIKSSLKQGIVR